MALLKRKFHPCSLMDSFMTDLTNDHQEVIFGTSPKCFSYKFIPVYIQCPIQLVDMKTENI